jgi:hypothetical protein
MEILAVVNWVIEHGLNMGWAGILGTYVMG